MENVTEALKLVLGVVIFVIAFTVLFQTASLARYTSEYLITERDKTTYYSYYNNEDSPVVKNNGIVSRKVTLEEIIPTLYRYSSESYGVTIIDLDDRQKIVARFDIETEELCSSWYQKTPSEIQKIIDKTNDYVLKPVFKALGRPEYTIEDAEQLKNLFLEIYKQVPNRFYRDDLNCAWTRDDNGISQRIDSDLSGIPVAFNNYNAGTQGNFETEANHYPKFSEGLVGKYKNATFTEYIITRDPNTYVTSEDGDKLLANEGAGQLRGQIKKEIIYVKN